MSALSGEIDRFSKLVADVVNDFRLKALVYSATGDRLHHEYVGTGLPYRQTVYELLLALEERGLTPLFLRAVYEEYPRRDDLRSEIRRLCPAAFTLPDDSGEELSVQSAGIAQSGQPSVRAFSPGFQRNIRPYLPQLDPLVWIDKVARISRQICRIEDEGGAAGTGFLVGPDCVLTNWHVVEDAVTAKNTARLVCRFDYLRRANGARNDGIPVAVRSDGCIASSPYAPAEVTQTPDNPPPKSDELDYALLRLETDVGNERGWMNLPALEADLKSGLPLLIVQHPDGGPMKMALDTYSIIGRTGSRVRYKTNTESGSSGSPCLTLNWDLVALHHFGDPAWRHPVFNQGIPIELIRADIHHRGHGPLIPAARSN